MLKALAPVVLAAAIAAPAANAAEYQERWSIGDWTLIVEDVPGEGETFTFCTLQAGDPHTGFLQVFFSSHDAPPPARFPWVAFVERTSSRHAPELQVGQDVTFAFSTNETFEGYVREDRDEAGGGLLRVADIDETDAQALLRTLTRAEEAAFIVPGGHEPAYVASVGGFAAAYAKMAEACQFPTTGVVGGVQTAAAEPEPKVSYEYFDYRDWSTIVETVDGEQDLRITCTIKTGGDGDPTMQATISNGDAGPPHFFPSVSLEEGAPRGYATQMKDGQPVTFVFDDGAAFPGVVMGGFNEEGFAFASAQVAQQSNQAVLQGMRRARALVVLAGGNVVYRASLSGFTAAYGKMAEQCGFTTAGVIN